MYDEECVAYAQQLSSQIILPHKTKRKINRRKEKIDEHKKSKQSLSESAIRAVCGEKDLWSRWVWSVRWRSYKGLCYSSDLYHCRWTVDYNTRSYDYKHHPASWTFLCKTEGRLQCPHFQGLASQPPFPRPLIYFIPKTSSSSKLIFCISPCKWDTQCWTGYKK